MESEVSRLSSPGYYIPPDGLDIRCPTQPERLGQAGHPLGKSRLPAGSIGQSGWTPLDSKCPTRRKAVGQQDLLTALLDACRRGLVTHEEAAKLVGIRKSELGDLVAWRMVETAAWRTFLAAFHHAFPECNASLGRLQSVDLKADDLWRGDLTSACRHYTPDEASKLRASQPHIFAPLSNAARDFAEPEKGDAWENIDGLDDRSPAHQTRALPRDNGQQLLDEAA